MNVEDERVPIPVPVATRQAETQQAGTSASAEKRSGGEPTTEDSSEDDSDVALKMAKVLSAFAAFTEVVQDASGDLRDLVQKALGAPSPRQAGKPRPTSKKWQHKKLNAVLGRLSD